MGKRSTGRKLAMQALYQVDVQKVDIEKIVEDFVNKSDSIDETKEWTTFLIEGVWKNKEAIDEKISEYAIDWDIDRLLIIDKSILRIAFFELCFTEIDNNIVINEALEIAKEFSEEDSSKFINGILGKYVDSEKN
ncbi:transcription antitermination factor NusB [bacterium]|jgi:transcription antitermination protein NusB|nr:transcription antitermination factor NusB [bacterium]